MCVFKTNYFLIVAALTLGFAGCSTSGGSDDSGSSDLASRLTSLGITIEDSATRLDSNNNEVDASLNPLGYKQSVSYKDCEVFISGVSGLSGSSGATFLEGSSVLATDSDSSWVNSYYNKCTDADMDGDGYDEVVAAYYDSDKKKIIVRELNKNKGTYSQKVSISPDAEISTTNLKYQMNIASGDLDGDGLSELIVVCKTNLIILDNDYDELYSAAVTPLNSDTDKLFIRAKCADFDCDGKDEIILVNGSRNNADTATLDIYNLSGSSLVSKYSGSVQNKSGSVGIQTPDFAAGDFDGDGLPEVAFAGDMSNSDNSGVVILDTSMGSDSEVDFAMLATSGTDGDSDWFRSVACGDLDLATDSSGNCQDEIVVYNDIYKLASDGTLEKTWSDKLNTPFHDMLAVGDVDGDYKADIVMCYEDRESMKAFKINASNNVETIWTLDTNDCGNSGGICLPDIDRDSSVLKYVGHNLQYTEPCIVAVITSPPYWAGINQNTTDTWMEFGKIHGKETETSNSAGISVSAIIGASVETPLWGSLGAVESTTTITNAFTWSYATAKSVTTTVGYGVSAGENKVVFTSIPYDVYTYEIVSSPKNSNVDTDDGEKDYTVISIPRTPQVVSASQEYYNANNGDGMDVDSSIITSTIGDPTSYPSYATRTALVNAGTDGIFSSNTGNDYINVGQGISYDTLTIESLAASSESYDYSLSVENETTATVSGVVVGAGLGYSYGYSYTNSVSDGTYAAVSLGNISSADYDAHKYSVGLMVYPVKAEDQNFTMVTCWVTPGSN